VELPGALLDQGRSAGRLRSLLGVVDEARDRWRRRRRRWLVAVVALCLVSLVASLLVALGPLSGGRAPLSNNQTIGVCAGTPGGCGSQRAGTAAALAASRWEPVPPGPLASRVDETAVWTGRQLLVWGGVQLSVGIGTSFPPPPQALGDGAAYDLATGTWKTLPQSPLSRRGGAAGVWTGTEAIFWGGYTPQTADGLDSTGAAYDPGTGHWRLLPPSPLSPRQGARAFWTGSEMLVFGGDQANDERVDDGALYRPSTNSWSLLPVIPSDPGAPLVGTTAVWTGRQFLVWLTYEASSQPSPNSQDIRTVQRSFSWTPGTSSWRRLPAPPSDVLTYGARAVWTGHRVLLVDGSSCLPGESCAAAVGSAPLATFDPSTATWGRAPGDLVAVNAGPVVWTGRALVALNQGTAQTGPAGALLSPGDGAVFDPGSDQWRRLPHANLGGLDETSAVWTGEDVLAWGDGTISVTNQVAVLVPNG
jgi:hypothetical protein